jgi:Ca2+-transporting ATPase
MEYLGLTANEVRERLEKYGKNEIAEKEHFSSRTLLISQFPTVINGILFVAAVFSFFLQHYLDGCFILSVILVNAITGFIQEYRAQKSLERLKEYTVPTAQVLRAGKEEKILASHLVPDDLVSISEGDRIPADGVLFEGHHIEVDESILTGESLPVIKDSRDILFMGALVTKGHGMFRVTKTGKETQFGQIAHTLSSIHSERTPLQKNLDKLGKIISFGAILVGLLTIPIGIFHAQPLLPLILVGASIGIAAIPEGLPAVVTIALAVGTHRMAKRGAIVRKMAAVETLGAVQVILVDKTGTITQNAMRVKRVWVKNKEALPQLLEACVLGNTASLIEKGNGKGFEVAGDRTDGALLLWAKEQTETPLPLDGHVLDEYVFDSETKTITTVWKRHDKRFVFVRGAPEAILEKSSLSEKEREELESQFESYAKEGLRTIAFGIKVEEHTEGTSREHLEHHLHFLGFMGLYDPPRVDVLEAIQKAKRAGIRVLMVTGDNELTALTLAKETGLIEKDEDVITGEALMKLSDLELTQLLEKISVFARTKPDQKLRIATLLQQAGYVVAVTGDGVNDALALKKSNVGISMGGESSTDVAKEASDIVLTNDSFATLIEAIEEGRTIYKNIVNAIVYLLSGNLAEISIVFFAQVFNLPFPLLPTQILWINLVTDSLPALALAVGSKDTTVLSKKPRDPKDSILSWKRVVVICVIGFGMATILLLLFTFLSHVNSHDEASTVVFNLLIYFHLLIVIVIGRHSLKKGNVFLLVTVLGLLLIQISLNYIPFTKDILHLVP